MKSKGKQILHRHQCEKTLQPPNLHKKCSVGQTSSTLDPPLSPKVAVGVALKEKHSSFTVIGDMLFPFSDSIHDHWIMDVVTQHIPCVICLWTGCPNNDLHTLTEVSLIASQLPSLLIFLNVLEAKLSLSQHKHFPIHQPTGWCQWLSHACLQASGKQDFGLSCDLAIYGH